MRADDSRSRLDTPDTALRGLDVERHLRDPALKQRFVTPMFNLVAPRYDEFTRRFSFGMDAGWKRHLVAQAAAVAPPGARCLDLACGTGDLAFALARQRPDAIVTGIDVSTRMLELARGRGTRQFAPNVTLSGGDLTALPCAAASIDLISAGYALRNVPDWRAGLAELARVLRPGGTLLTLDFYRPAGRLWRAAFLSYLSLAGRIYGWMWHREPVAYGYIALSIDQFVTSREFSDGLRAHGFRVSSVRSWLAGGIAMHTAVRES